MLDTIRPYALDLALPIIVVLTVFAVLKVIGGEPPKEAFKRKWPVITGMVVAAIAVGVGLQIGVMRLTAPDVDQIIAADPLLPGVLKAFPEQESAIRERLERAANRGDAAVDREIHAIGSDIGTTLLPQLIGSASDEAVVAFVDVFAANMEVAAAQGGSVCVSYMSAGGGGPMPEFSDEAKVRANDVVLQILAEGVSGKPKRALDETSVSVLIDQVVTRAYELAGDRELNFDGYANLAALRGEEAKIRACWAALYMHLAILELPAADAAALYRTLLAAS